MPPVEVMLVAAVRVLAATAQIAVLPVADRAGVEAVAAVVTDVFIVAVRSPLVGALVRLVAVPMVAEAAAVPPILTALTPIWAVEVETVAPAISTISDFAKADAPVPVKFTGWVVP